MVVSYILPFINNDGPDYRDFKIVGGDKIPEVEFNDKDKEEIEIR